MSLVLAVIYTHFASRSKSKYKEFFRTRDHAFQQAHELLYKASFFHGGSNEENTSVRPSSRSMIHEKIELAKRNNERVKDTNNSTYSEDNCKIGLIEWTDMCQYINPKMPVEISRAIFWTFDREDTGFMSLRKFSKAMKYSSMHVNLVTNTAIMRKGNEIFRVSKMPGMSNSNVPRMYKKWKISLRCGGQ